MGKAAWTKEELHSLCRLESEGMMADSAGGFAAFEPGPEGEVAGIAPVAKPDVVITFRENFHIVSFNQSSDCTAWAGSY